VRKQSGLERGEGRSGREEKLARREPNGAASAEVRGAHLDGIDEGVAHVSTKGEILYANARFAELLGRGSNRKADGAMLKDFVSPVSWGDLDAALYQGARKQTEAGLSVEDPTHGIVRTIRLVRSPVQWKRTTTIKITASETTALVEKNRALEDTEAPLHKLSARIRQLQDEERRRIARDLRDITGEELAVVIMALSQLANGSEDPGTEIQQRITDAAGLVRKIEDEMRTLSYALHPPLLDEFGLGSALNWYAEGFMKRSGVDVRVEVAEGLPRLTAEKEMAVFRVMQEGLTNVLRHSGSRTARICVSFDSEFVALLVDDEGRGIEYGRAARASTAAVVNSVGIAGMRGRLQQLGGSLKVRPLAKGTEVAAVVPIGEAKPVEPLPSEAEILRMAEALGYRGEARESSAAPGRVKKRVRIADDQKMRGKGSGVAEERSGLQSRESPTP
jgi:two-component system, NarL family, sensor kinase